MPSRACDVMLLPCSILHVFGAPTELTNVCACHWHYARGVFLLHVTWVLCTDQDPLPPPPPPNEIAHPSCVVVKCPIPGTLQSVKFPPPRARKKVKSLCASFELIGRLCNNVSELTAPCPVPVMYDFLNMRQ